MKKVAALVVAGGFVAVAGADSTVLSGNTYRIQDNADASYTVSSVSEAASWPSGVPTPSFWFDCRQTNGWEFAADEGGRLRVTKIPTLVAGSSRFLTTDQTESGTQFPSWSIEKPVFVASDPELGGQPMIDLSDGKSLNSKIGMIFDSAGDSETKNQLQPIGTVVAVYGSQDGGGSFLAGGVAGTSYSTWTRQRIKTLSDKNNDSVRVDYPAPMAGASAGLSYRTGLARHFGHVSAPRDSGFSGGWEVVSVLCADNDMSASGIGLGDMNGTYYHSGGMKIAEMIFFCDVLTDEQVAKVERHLTRKWFPDRREDDGYNGRTSLGWYRSSTKGSSLSTTFDIPANETLEIGKLQGGRTKDGVEPKIVKSGAGVLDAGDFSDYGGTIEAQGGKIAFRKRAVPTVDSLPSGLFLRFDANDADCCDFADPEAAGRKYVKGLRNLASGTWKGKPVAAHQATESLQPWLRENEIGDKGVIDFGLTSEGETGRILRFATYSDSDYADDTLNSV